MREIEQKAGVSETSSDEYINVSIELDNRSNELNIYSPSFSRFLAKENITCI